MTDATGPYATATFEILTGAERGTLCWLNGPTLDLSLDAQNRLRVGIAAGESAAAGVYARLHRAGEGYEIEALGDQPLFVNGKRVASVRLAPRDLVEFGDLGPLTRFRLHRQGERSQRSLGDMLDDAIDYTRGSRKPRWARFNRATRNLLADFVLRSTVIFRVAVIAALAVLTYFVWQQYQADLEFRRQAETRGQVLDDFARRLARTSEEALKPADLNQLQIELRHSLSAAAERLSLLEQRSAAASRIIADAAPAIAFLQGAWAFREVESKRLLRYRTGADGRPLFSLRGQPLLTLEGDGEVAEIEFTGTAFAVGAAGVLLTNRHVAQPWEEDASLEAMQARGMEPVLRRFVGFVPGQAEPFELELLGIGEDTDLAVLRAQGIERPLPFLRLGAALPAPGDEVIVMGYPTGIVSMLAQSGEAFVAELEKEGEYDAWRVAARLAEAGYIRPLASRGIVAQRSDVTLVYDADTTHGGSGGPVLDIDGRVVAVNTAIIAQYGGSNFGIPIDFARRLLADAGITVD